MVYRPASVLAGALVSLVTALGTLVWLARPGRRAG
jgi:hypothetical protein